MINLNDLITNYEYKCNDQVFFGVSNPNIVQGNYEFLPYNGNTLEYKRNLINCGSIKCNDLLVGKAPEVGFYQQEESILYRIVPNSIERGVVCVCQSTDERLLLTSGALSGCTACSVYLPYIETLYFFHVGKAMGHGKYNAGEKNRDLFNAIALNLNGEFFLERNLLTDTQLLDKLMYFIFNLDLFPIFIDIFSVIPYNSFKYNKEDPFGLKLDYSMENHYKSARINLYSYPLGGEFVVTKSENLYSTHYFYKCDSSPNINMHKKRNNVQM